MRSGSTIATRRRTSRSRPSRAHRRSAAGTGAITNISTESWNPNQSFFDSGAFFGDYNGFAAAPGVMYPIWTDGRNTPGVPLGQTDIFTNVENTGP